VATTDGFIIVTGAGGGGTLNLPSAASAGAGKFFYFYVQGASAVTINAAGGDVIWKFDGTSGLFTSAFTLMLISNGTDAWYEVAK